jgi:hypothetical protein
MFWERWNVCPFFFSIQRIAEAHCCLLPIPDFKMVMTLPREGNPALTGTHCVIHRQALDVKILRHDLCTFLNIRIKSVSTAEGAL